MDQTKNKIALQIKSFEEIFNIPQEQISQAYKFTFFLKELNSEQGDFSDSLNRVEDFQNLQNLCIDCSENSRIKELINLKQFIQQLNNLTRLKLIFRFSEFLTKESILEIVLCLQNKFHLKSLALDLYNIQQLNDEHITQICQFISQIKDLNSLDLQFGWNHQITQLALSQISSCLKNHLNLQKLNLCFHYLTKISRIEDFPQTLAKLTNLRNISLTLGGCHILEEQQLISINESISNALFLEHLFLNFSQYYKMTQQAVNQLANSLKNFQNLKYFYLNLSDNESIKDLQSLGQSLYQLTSLNEIYLHLGKMDQLKKGPFGSLITHNQCIQILDVDLSNCSNLSHENLQLFNRDLNFVSNLKQLTIRLNYLNSKTRLFRNELCQVIKDKTKLIKIQVKNLGDDEIMIKFIQVISQLKSLNCVGFKTKQSKQKFLNKIYKIKRLVLFSDDF